MLDWLEELDRLERHKCSATTHCQDCKALVEVLVQGARELIDAAKESRRWQNFFGPSVQKSITNMAAKINEVHRLRTLMRRLEWANCDDGDHCPCCDAPRYDTDSLTSHEPGCELAAVLARQI